MCRKSICFGLSRVMTIKTGYFRGDIYENDKNAELRCWPSPIESKASLETARGLAKCTEGVKLQVTYNLVELHMILAKILQINVIKSNAA